MTEVREAGTVASTIITVRAAAGERPAPDARTHATLLNPDVYKDCQELASGTSRASQEALAQLASLSAERVTELADSLLLAQPQLATTFLLDKGFLQGQVPADAAARRVVRSIHAVHRESLVVYPA